MRTSFHHHLNDQNWESLADLFTEHRVPDYGEYGRSEGRKTIIDYYSITPRRHPEWSGRPRSNFAHAEAGPGDFIFVPPYVPHQEINASTHEPLECVLVRSDSEAVVVPPAVALTRDHLARVPLVRTPPSGGEPR